MTPGLRVISPGMQTTIQDLGRIGYQRFGVPVSGALDTVALRAANALAGNSSDAAALEALYQGPVLEVLAESIRVAVVGIGAGLEIAGEPARRVPALRSVRLERGARVRVLVGSGALGAVLAVEGGIAIEPVLGSRATYVRAAIGGLDGRPLAAGDTLSVRQERAGDTADIMLATLDLPVAREVRVVLGPQDDYFTPEAIADFLGTTWRVSAQADRMGLRLEGPRLAHAKGYNIVSDGIAPGAIQVPGNGQPIVLLADRQTSGGYPKIATVASADLPALGRVLPGAEISFRAIDVETAEAARCALESELAALPSACIPVGAEIRPPDTARLLESNLVSGVVDAAADDW
ncbi:MAG: biotin-dependent carboxyltransferase family protein [Hyphomicrobiaceae bacterium]|nr:biotin-dependent carboxyltransferase family protein [Hyphomicrobiaceae bacterium]